MAALLCSLSALSGVGMPASRQVRFEGRSAMGCGRPIVLNAENGNSEPRVIDAAQCTNVGFAPGSFAHPSLAIVFISKNNPGSARLTTPRAVQLGNGGFGKASCLAATNISKCSYMFTW